MNASKMAVWSSVRMQARLGAAYSGIVGGERPGLSVRTARMTLLMLTAACASDAIGDQENTVAPTETEDTENATPTMAASADTTPVAMPAGTRAMSATDPTTSPAQPPTGMMPSTAPAPPNTNSSIPAMPPTTDPGMPTDDDYAKYHDPGLGEWEKGTPEECKIDPSAITTTENVAIFRYGKLCYMNGNNTSTQNFSATKTMGGVLAGRAAYLVKDVQRTGPGTGPILHEDKATDWLGQVTYNRDALLNNVMSMTAFNSDLSYGKLMFSYDTLGTREISTIVDVAMVAVKQLSTGVPTSEVEFMQKEVFDKLGMKASSWPGMTIGTGWTGTLEDMGRVGTMLLHDGWYNGEHFLEPRWVYRMSHPAHEDANSSYGQLAWLNNGTDDCSPPAYWPSYPHPGSESPDCHPMGRADCHTGKDIGTFSAQGLGGQFVLMHPGLDLVVVGHNFAGGSAGQKEQWASVLPGIIAKDPMAKGDRAAFCKAYGSGDYAPDLLVPRALTP